LILAGFLTFVDPMLSDVSDTLAELKPDGVTAQAEAITAQSAEWQLDPAPVDDELGRLTGAFNRLLARLGDALRMQRQFMADASHELRTPVSVIQTATEVTLDRDERDVAEYRDALLIIQEQTARLSRTVEDMFVLARADAGGHRLIRRPLYLDEIVAECVKAAAVAASQRQIQLVTRIEPDVSMHGDDGLLRQMVTNLIDNALRYTPEGRSVTVAVGRDRTDAIVSVSDTGPGVASADRERIFERFVRLDPARSSSSGAGLGLPIARWIAEQHGGTLALQQSATGGSTFIAHLPVKSEVVANLNAT
jgi:two-component system OmpR family sensor kinase